MIRKRYRFLSISSILLMGVAILLMSIKFETHSFLEPFAEGHRSEEGQHVQLAWPQFVTEAGHSWLLVNQQVSQQTDSICRHFLEEIDPGQEGRLTGSYEIAYVSEALLSLRLDYHYDFLTSRDEERFSTVLVNWDMKAGKPLLYEDCFQLKGSLSDWIRCVEEGGQDIDPDHPLPEDFSFDQEGVVLFFHNLESEKQLRLG